LKKGSRCDTRLYFFSQPLEQFVTNGSRRSIDQLFQEPGEYPSSLSTVMIANRCIVNEYYRSAILYRTLFIQWLPH